MNQNEIAKKICVSRGHFCEVVNGRRNLSFETARKLVDLLGGPILCWIDPDQVAIRRQVWADFVARNKRAEK